MTPQDAQQDAPEDAQQLLLSTGSGCGLAIGRYPRFSYNASGGGGAGQLGPTDAAGWREVTLDPTGLRIPPLDWRSTRLFGLPLPPGLCIAIEPERLAGRWHQASGALELAFRARFRFSAFDLRAPDLLVETQLSTGQARGSQHRAEGRPLDAAGQGRLVGVALVPATGATAYDCFLGLPAEALAVLECRLQA